MSRALKLYNSFSRTVREATLSNKEVISIPHDSKPIHASLYMCGPTVYSDSHMGHALTYVRADIFRRVMSYLFNVKLTTVMNITDVDDKILSRACEEGKDYRSISERYNKSFNEDMDLIRVIPPDVTIKISDQIDLITQFIGRLEQKGHAYITHNGDVYFRVASVKNYVGRVDERNAAAISDSSRVKENVRDFALWKAAKPNEPVWSYKSTTTGTVLPGRPGWHVQCSAISSAIFGDKLDFHYGGKDLIFPHHYNEQACCCAYHELDTSESLHVWSNNWLHSGHLVLGDDKMSKSLGNVVNIKSFINDSSVNALRLLCISSHYRADVTFNSELLGELKALDHKISAFSSFISEELRLASQRDLSSVNQSLTRAHDIQNRINQINEQMIEGVCNDLDMSIGLREIIQLSKYVYSFGSGGIGLRELVHLRQLLSDFCLFTGLEYRAIDDSSYNDLVDIIQDFRRLVRTEVIDELRRSRKKESAECSSPSNSREQVLETLLTHCDNLRAKMDYLGIVIRDTKTKS